MSSSEKPHTGQVFNLWRGACDFCPPDIVGRDRPLGLTDGQKRLYERLVRYAGRDGHCWPAQATLAGDLGKGERQFFYDLEKLRADGVIAWRFWKAANRRGNAYVSLWHPIFERQQVAGQGETFNDSSGKRPISERPSTAGEFSTRSVYKRASEKYSGREQERPPLMARRKNQRPKSASYRVCWNAGASHSNRPGALFAAGQELGASADQLCRFLEEKVEEKPQRRRSGSQRSAPAEHSGLGAWAQAKELLTRKSASAMKTRRLLSLERNVVQAAKQAVIAAGESLGETDPRALFAVIVRLPLLNAMARIVTARLPANRWASGRRQTAASC